MSILLPKNATEIERAIELACARELSVPIASLWSAESCPEHLLPWLAWALHVDGWSSAATEADKRRMVRESILLHRKKGTPWSIKRALAASGFGANSRLIEGRTMRRYDGTLYADGSDIYGGHRWAEYQLEVDLGETSGLDAGIAARIADLAREWAPASRHLTRLDFRADVSERVSSSETAVSEASWSGASLRSWRRYYDGTHRYDQGVLLTYGGSTLANGSRRYQGWAANDTHWRAGAPESDTTLALAWSDADRQQALPRYDGATQADGRADYGDSAPAADDAVMPITVVRHIRYDGRYRYGADNAYSGAHRYDGSRRYLAGRIASGDEIIYLEAV